MNNRMRLLKLEASIKTQPYVGWYRLLGTHPISPTFVAVAQPYFNVKLFDKPTQGGKQASRILVTNIDNQYASAVHICRFAVETSKHFRSTLWN